MSQSLFTAAAGLQAQQQNIDTIANNIANINTNGYRRSRVDFNDAIYTAMQNSALPADGQTGNLQLGSGVIAETTRQIFTAGALQQTERPMDVALGGEGFFAVENPGGPTLYTRDGTFQSSSLNGRNYLVTSNGNFVLDKDGQRISSTDAFDNMSVDAGGRISVGGKAIAELGVYKFANPDGLEAAGGRTFLATAAAGSAQTADTDIRQGFIEGSNVDLAEEMSRLINSQRAYAFLSRAITTADEMRSIANDIRR